VTEVRVRRLSRLETTPRADDRPAEEGDTSRLSADRAGVPRYL